MGCGERGDTASGCLVGFDSLVFLKVQIDKFTHSQGFSRELHCQIILIDIQLSKQDDTQRPHSILLQLG